MPFGAVYGALFFAVVGFWLTVATLGDVGAPLQASRLCLALVCLMLALALLLRRAWARWLGAAVAMFLISFHLWGAPLGDGVAPNLVLFGSLVGAVLLAVPATGDVRRDLEPGKRPAPRLGRVLAATAALGIVGTAAGLLLGLAPGDAAVAAGPSESSAPAALAGRIQWSSFGGGIEKARAQNKPLLVNFVANWCGYCRKMDRTTWKDPGVVSRSADLVAVRVDAEEGLERDGFTGRDLAQRYGVSGFPTLVMIDADGQEIARTSGYQEARQLASWIDGSLARARRMGLGGAVPAAAQP
jgi:thiol:disulfide interchange protein